MQIIPRRGKAVLAVTAIGSAAPAQAHHARPIDWSNEVAWPRYHRLCPGN